MQAGGLHSGLGCASSTELLPHVSRQQAQAKQARPLPLLRFAPRRRGTTAEELSWLESAQEDPATNVLRQMLVLGCQAGLLPLAWL